MMMQQSVTRADKPYKSEPGTGRRAPRRCEHPGCDKATRERKPYCVDHIESTPYVQRLMERMEEDQ